MNSQGEWHVLITKAPRDRLLQLAFADWLEEQGLLNLAGAWRYISRERKYPRKAPARFLGDILMSYDWRDVGYFGNRVHPHCLLEVNLLHRLRKAGGGREHPYREYASPIAALKALADAWARREEGKQKRREKRAR